MFTDMSFVAAYPMKSKSLCCEALKRTHEDVGIPNELLVDNAKEMTEPDTEFYKECRKVRTILRTIKPYTSKQNPCERMVGNIRRQWREI